MRSTVRHIVIGVSAALTAASLQVVLAPQAPSTAAEPSARVMSDLLLSPGYPMRNETYTVRGYVDRYHSPVRPVWLQRPSGTTWKTVATSKTGSKGAYSFTQRADRGGAAQVRRVYAPAATIKGAYYAAQDSVPVTVTPDSQQLSLALPTITQVGKSLEGLSTSPPIFDRWDRVHDLQLRTPSTGKWTTVRSTKLSYAGRHGWHFTLKPTKTGTFVYRSVARAYHGAGRMVSAPVKMIVSPGATTTVGALTVVNKGADGSPPTGEHPSGPASMSGDGRYVAYWTDDPGVVAGGNPVPAVVLNDRKLGTTKVISIPGYYDGIAERGAGFPVKVSHDGRFVAYLARTQADPTYRIYRYDVAAGTNTLVSRTPAGQVPNGPSASPSLTADGRYVVYSSTASDILEADQDATSDVFRWDGKTGTTTLVSHTVAASTQPAIGGDGRFIAFRARASDLAEGHSSPHQDIYTYDTVEDHAAVLSTTGPDADGDSSEPEISADGRTIVFVSAATNLLQGDTNGHTDVFVASSEYGIQQMVSRTADDSAADGDSFAPAVSADGRFVGYGSEATNLVASDTNGAPDLFLADTFAGTTLRAKPHFAGPPPGDSMILAPSISDDGTRMSFSQAVGDGGLDWDDYDYRENVFLWLLSP